MCIHTVFFLSHTAITLSDTSLPLFSVRIEVCGYYMFYIFVEETDEGASGSSDYKEGVCLIFTFVCLFS